MKNPKVIGNLSQQARATNELKFYRRGKPGIYMFSNMSSFMFRRKPVLQKHPEVAEAVRKVVTPFSTNAPAQAAALAALAATAEMRRRCDLVIAERQRVTEAVRKLVPDVPDSQANFIWLPLGERSTAFATACAEGGVIVRPFAGEGVRVTIGTPDENDAFLALAEDFCAGSA